MKKYRIEKWPGWYPHWIVRVVGESGVIGFTSFYNALEHVRWAITYNARREQGGPQHG